MRRKNQEITDPEKIASILDAAQVLHLGMADGNAPYVVPVSFGYMDGKIFIHSSPQGLKLRMLARNPQVCFQVESDVELITEGAPCQWTLSYYSVIGFGKAHLAQTDVEKSLGLDVITRHYQGDPLPYSAEELQRLEVIVIEVDRMTGKFSRKKG